MATRWSTCKYYPPFPPHSPAQPEIVRKLSCIGYKWHKFRVSPAVTPTGSTLSGAVPRNWPKCRSISVRHSSPLDHCLCVCLSRSLFLRFSSPGLSTVSVVEGSPISFASRFCDLHKTQPNRAVGCLAGQLEAGSQHNGTTGVHYLPWIIGVGFSSSTPQEGTACRERWATINH